MCRESQRSLFYEDARQCTHVIKQPEAHRHRFLACQTGTHGLDAEGGCPRGCCQKRNVFMAGCTANLPSFGREHSRLRHAINREVHTTVAGAISTDAPCVRGKADVIGLLACV